MNKPTSWRHGAESKRNLPPDWYHKNGPRQAAMTRDGNTCQWVNYDTNKACGAPASDCDHIGDPDDHNPANLRAICAYHHRKRTAIQGVNARGPRPNRARPKPPTHPGLID